MTGDADALVRDAIKAFRGGNKAQARTLLERATELDSMNEQAWMWMSAVVESVDDQRVCLENVIYINPHNEKARQGLKMLEGKSSSAPKPAADADPFANASFAPADDTPPTATSSASSAFQPKEPPAEVYDNWISGMGIGGSKPATAGPEPADAFTIDDDAFSSIFSGEFEEDSADVESVNPRATHSNDVNQLRSMFGDDSEAEDDEPAFNVSSGPFKADPFTLGDDDSLDDLFNDSAFTSPPARAPAKSPAQAASPSPRSTQNSKTSSATSTASKAKMSPVERAPSGSPFVTGAIDIDADEPDPSEYFREIPATIKPTRLPGTDARSPALLRVGLGILVLLNISAAAILILRSQG
jgi:hypothetical protein